MSAVITCKNYIDDISDNNNDEYIIINANIRKLIIE